MFGKNKARTAEEILKLIDDLPEEERKNLLSALNEGGADETERSEAEQDTQGTEQDLSERSEETAEETAAEQADSEEAPSNASAEEVVTDEDTSDVDGEATDETPSEQAEEGGSEQDITSVMETITRRIDALEAQLSELKQAQSEAVAREGDRDFGLNPSAPQGSDEDDERYSAVMRGYAGNNARRYN